MNCLEMMFYLVVVAGVVVHPEGGVAQDVDASVVSCAGGIVMARPDPGSSRAQRPLGRRI